MADLGTLRPGAGNTTNLPTTGSIIAAPGGATALSDDSDATFDDQNTNASGTYQYGRELGDTPSDFATMDTVAVQCRTAWEATPSNSTWDDVAARIVASDGSTVLAAADSGGAFQSMGDPPDTATFGLRPASPQAFSFVDTSANKTTWDGAIIQFQWQRTRNKGGDALGCRISEGYVTGTYTQASNDRTGSGTPTEANDTSAGTGEFTPPQFTGSGTPSEANDTSAGSGNFTEPSFTGSGTPTEQADTSAGTGTFTPPPVTGSGTPSEANDTSAGSGTFTGPNVTGSGTPTEANDTSAGSGSFVPNPTGSGSPVEANDTSAGVGSFTGTGGECSIPAVTQFPAPYARTSWGFFGPGFLQIFTCVAGGTTINTEGARLRTRAGTTTVDTGGTTINTEGARLRLRAGETTITLEAVTVDTTGGHLGLRAGGTEILTGTVIDTTGGRLRLRAGTTTVISGRQFIPDVTCQVDHAGVACTVDSVGVGCTTTALTVECLVET